MGLVGVGGLCELFCFCICFCFRLYCLKVIPIGADEEYWFGGCFFMGSFGWLIVFWTCCSCWIFKKDTGVGLCDGFVGGFHGFSFVVGFGGGGFCFGATINEDKVRLPWESVANEGGFDWYSFLGGVGIFVEGEGVDTLILFTLCSACIWVREGGLHVWDCPRFHAELLNCWVTESLLVSLISICFSSLIGLQVFFSGVVGICFTRVGFFGDFLDWHCF